MSDTVTNYLLGHTDHERRRLTLQAMVLNPLTEGFLMRAGLRGGMRVLDLGCGIGEVAMIAARLVGPTGHVTALDVDRDTLDVARSRASEAGLPNISFERANVAEYSAQEPYDAVVGRHILIHTPDPLAILRRAAAQVRRGGVVAFQEYDLSRYFPNTPAKPLYERIFQLLVAFFTRVTQADIGMRLFQMFHDIELTKIQSRAEFGLDGGPDCPYYEWITDTVRSLLPKLEATRIATAAELDVDTLADRLREEAVAVGGCLAGPIMAGTFGNKL
jgi:2-polyprenyl-3-methyl-5-hydroxy-6-metoxy-1,4-benzoquinol methylase